MNLHDVIRKPLVTEKSNIGREEDNVVTLAVDPRAALERANAKFQRRFEGVEKLAEQRGLEMGRASLEELDRLWDEVKRKR